MLLPLLLDPFKGEGVCTLVALLCVRRSLAHDYKTGEVGRSCTNENFSEALQAYWNCEEGQQMKYSCTEHSVPFKDVQL